MFTTITICAWDLHLDYVFKTTLYHHQKDLLVEENLGFLAIYLRQWFILFPSRRKWMETRVFLVIVHSVYPKSPPQTSWNKLKAVNCKVVSKLPLLHKTIGNAKKLWKSTRHKRISFDTPVLGLGQQQKCSQGQQRPFPLFNSAFYLGLNDRRRCSFNYFPLGPTQTTLQQFLCSPAQAM